MADKIQRLRGTHSNQALADACGCSATNIQKVAREGTIPNFVIGTRLAAFLGVPAEWLADDEQEWPPPPESQDQKILDAVHRALRPFADTGELASWEQEIVVGLRERDAGDPDDDTNLAGGLPLAIRHLFHAWDAAHDMGIASTMGDDAIVPDLSDVDRAAQEIADGKHDRPAAKTNRGAG